MKIVVVGLGYVGLPLALALAKKFPLVGLDIDESRIEELKQFVDRTHEATPEMLRETSLQLTASPSVCHGADVYIVTVPTPVDIDNKPDLTPVIGATKTVASLIDAEKCPVIIYESTVYPGVTEEVCGPLIEEVSGLKRGRDFRLGYSPERINPGDREHTVDRITKVIAGEDDKTTEQLAEIYGAVTTGGVFRAATIKTAEAAKVIENAQRDINIAFVNEITQIFGKLGISIWDVLDAAKTKWNFLNFRPGLVGGHCIGVDPYYLSYRAQQLGLDPKVILSGRSTNDGMANWVADWITSKVEFGSKILVMGLTFKENIPDLRNSKVADLVSALKMRGFEVVVHDPMARAEEAAHEYGITLSANAMEESDYGAIIGAVAHDEYRNLAADLMTNMLRGNGLAIDLTAMWRGDVAAQLGKRYLSL